MKFVEEIDAFVKYEWAPGRKRDFINVIVRVVPVDFRGVENAG